MTASRLEDFDLLLQDRPPPRGGPVDALVRRGALLDLLGLLSKSGYAFVTPTPATHARVTSRADRRRAKDVHDVLGWSLPFSADLLPRPLLDLLAKAEALRERDDGLLTATVRVSSVCGTLFLHSAYPTTGRDSVFLGPDSYRFANLIAARGDALPRGARILDYGAGAGVGGITAARMADAAALALADVNPKALFLSSINAEFAGLDHNVVEVSRPLDIDRRFHLVVTHPPFMMDPAGRAYRHGGGLFGGQLSFEWVRDAMRLLLPGGQLILHTGASIVAGRDVLRDALREAVPATNWHFAYEELDPDIFSEDLDQPAYLQVERIAAVGLVLTRRQAEKGANGANRHEHHCSGDC